MTIDTIDTPSAATLSFPDQLRGLNPGESFSRVRAIDPTTPVSRLPDELPNLRQQVRNNCMPAIARATKTTGYTYTCEVGDVIMPAGNFYVVAVITRVA